jgi:serine protease Do
MATIEPTAETPFDPLTPPPRPTTPPVRRGFVWILLALCLVTSVVYGVPYMIEQSGYAYELGRARASLESLEKLDRSGALERASEMFRLATHAVSPAVVNIRTKNFNPGGTEGLGSGVVIDKEKGYIVTNQHVIRNADAILVRVGKRTEMMGELVGEDPRTDLAVIKVKGSLPLAAAWGDSDLLEEGDWVLAIGSPYGLERTVSAGIVSATSRTTLSAVGQDTYEDFIQTDVAINPGNSGGPLVNLKGEIVGINTAISVINPEQGGNQGLGFAIASSMARRVVDQLITSKKVNRAYLGVVTQPLTPDQAKQMKVADAKGAYVVRVLTASPAEKVGLRLEDVITALDGKPVEDPSTLRNRIFTLEPGRKVPVTIVRGGLEKTLEIEVARQPDDQVITFFGFSVKDEPLDASGTTVTVDQVVAGGAGARAGLKPGTRIPFVGRRRVYSKAEFDMSALQFGGGPLLLGIFKDGKLEPLTVGAPEPNRP